MTLQDRSAALLARRKFFSERMVPQKQIRPLCSCDMVIDADVQPVEVYRPARLNGFHPAAREAFTTPNMVLVSPKH